MKLQWIEPVSTKKRIAALLIELGFWHGTSLPEWVQLANENFETLTHSQAEEMLKELQQKHSQLIRLYNLRWLSIIKPFKN